MLRQCAAPLSNYHISNKGELWRTIDGRPLEHIKSFLSNKTYPCHALSTGAGARCLIYVHKLVFQTWNDGEIPAINGRPCIDHIDRNPLNNHIDNLKYCSYSSNNKNRRKFVWSERKKIANRLYRATWREFVNIF